MIHIDLPGCYDGRAPLKVMSNLICKAMFLTAFSAAYISLGVLVSFVVCSKAVLSGRKDRYLYAVAQHFHFNLCLCVAIQKLLSDAVILEKTNKQKTSDLLV